MTAAGGVTHDARPLCRCCQKPMVKNGTETRASRRSNGTQGWKCAAKVSERNARRIRIEVGQKLSLYLGHAKTPEAHEFSKSLLQQRKDELHGCVQ